MKPGLYVLCRKIYDGPAAHQFVVLVPENKTCLKLQTRPIQGVRCLVLGAYESGGFLRAMEFADSDLEFFKSRLALGDKSSVQLDEVELGICLAVSQDVLLEHTYRAFIKYKTHEGCKAEIKYPTGIFEQLSSSRYNSNSWAQSLVFWSTMAIAPAHAIKDFDGLDVGNDRLIPKRFFESCSPQHRGGNR